MTTVIRAENLGKQCLIRHEQQGQRFAHDSLGESLVNGGRALVKPLCSGSHAPAWEPCLNPLRQSVFRRWIVGVGIPTLERGNEKNALPM